MQEEFVFPNAIKKIYGLLKIVNARNVFLVRGKKSFEKCGVKEDLRELYESYNVKEFYNFSVNPKIEEAKKGFDIFKNHKSDIIIAIGGGSVIDMAKIIKYLWIEESSNKKLPIISIPTTAGTGSESTHFAVVYINNKKESYASADLLPEYTIVDSNLLKSLPTYQMAVSGLDAFSQSIESFWSIHATLESMKFAEKAMVLIWKNLFKAIEGDKLAISNIALGSNLAGKAINITKTTAPHALSYGFTSCFGLAHGHAVSLFLPFFIKLHKNLSNDLCNDINGSKFVNNKLKTIAELLNVNPKTLEYSVIDFYKNLKIEINFKNLNISQSQYLNALNGMSQERLKNNPALVSNEMFVDIYLFNNLC